MLELKKYLDEETRMVLTLNSSKAERLVLDSKYGLTKGEMDRLVYRRVRYAEKHVEALNHLLRLIKKRSQNTIDFINKIQ